MNISDNVLSKACLCLAIFFTVALVYLMLNNQLSEVNVFSSVGMILMAVLGSYLLSDKYKHRNSLNKLIKRNGNVLTCKNTGAIFTSTININKIEKVSISNNYVSIIEHNNGNGYDIFLTHSAQKEQDVMNYIQTLFTQDELSAIDLVRI